MTPKVSSSKFRQRLANFRLSQPNRGALTAPRVAPINLTNTAYLSFAAYLFVTTVVLTDPQIFTASTGFSLPILSLQVPFLGFFILAPLALLLLHAQALDGISSSVKNLPEASPGTGDEGSALTAQILLLGVAPATLAVVFWRLADYQSKGISSLHFIVFIADIWLSFRAARKLTRHGIRSTGLKRLMFAGIAIIIIKAVVCWDVFVRPWTSSVTRYLVMESDYFIDDEGQVQDPIGLIPNIVVDRTKLLFDIDIAKYEALAALHGRESWKEYFDDRGVTVDIRNRSLRLAYLHGQTLPRVWAHDADLQGANLSFAFMPGAVFVNANLQDANLELANLSGSYLDRTNFRETIAVMTNFRGASLDQAEFQGAYIRQSDFTAAWMPQAEFQLAMVLGSTFSGAYMENVNFWGAFAAWRPEFILSPLEKQPPLSITAPSNEKLRSWGLFGPVKSVKDLDRETEMPPLVPSDASAVDSWVESFCQDPLRSGDIGAVKMALKIYSLADHPAHTLFSNRLRQESHCGALLSQIAGDRSYLAPAESDGQQR